MTTEFGYPGSLVKDSSKTISVIKNLPIFVFNQKY